MEQNINFEDLKTAYRYKSDKDLKLTYMVFQALQKPMLLRFLKSCANGIINYHLPFKGLIKNTIFKLFIAGETIDEAFTVIHNLQKYNVKSVLDYVSEGEKNESNFISNTNTIVSNIKKLGLKSPGNYVSIKLTGLEDPMFLASCNARHFPTDLFLKPRFDNLLARVDLICMTAKENNVVLFIDAEDRYMQDIIDTITEHMMAKHNRQSAVVFNTLQMYLKDRLNYLEQLIEKASQNNYVAGIKLVRGAYLEREREQALLENRESPVYDSKIETDLSFDTAVEICLKNHTKVITCIASHNYKSAQLAIDLINKYQINNAAERVKFSQLYGMCDGLTFNLAACGYDASKYLPYGEVKKAIPYLIRRSDENTSINGQVKDELTRLNQEIINRKNKK